jgi:hypothetical protein
MRKIGLLARLVAVFLLAFTAPLVTAPAAAQTSDEKAPLTATIAALDSKVFDAYNRCDMLAFSGYFSPKVEFYHDTGGATFDRKTVISNTRKYICHKVRRELITASLKVYPIKDFGAIAEGEHRFCQVDTGNCEGIAKFLMIWKLHAGEWRITRVVSFGHRALTDAEKLRN